ncbi:MAG: S8 family serine peptidase, partial [Bacteroidota bacterium]
MYKLFVSIVILVGSFSAWGQTDKSYHLPQGLQKGAYHPTTIIVKLKDAANIGTSSKSRSSSGILGKLKSTASISSIENAFPKSIRNKKNVRSTGKSPLENIYKVDLNEGEDLVASINSLLELEEVVYAEPYFAHQPLAIPNDPNANPTTGAQYYLGVVKAYDAWSIEKGDTNIVIGVLDTGVQPDHPDLRNSIAYNYDDPINGIDDDGDGLIDNFVGWDYADDDNNPFADTDPHGTEMAGISAATTDNSAGMAGIGYRSKFLPIKMFRSGSNFFFGGYESIVLAADLGCDVINLSWGSANSFSQFGQDAINYAVLERNVAIVAAAGNDRQFDNFYPASFDNVLSVAATDIDDNRAFFSSYSYNVDITAPGVDIYATTNGNSYIFRSGTSEASAITAGAMALVRARFPELTGQQVIEKIRVNTDDIYNIGSNGDLEGLLGKGRLNVAKALEVNNSPSLRIDEVAFDNGSGEHAFFGDTLTISADIINFLSPTSNAQITLSSDSPFAEILEGDWGIGVLNTLNETSNSQQPFKVLLSKNLPPNEEIVFKLTMQDGAYNDFQHFIINSSPERLELDNGQLELT